MLWTNLSLRELLRRLLALHDFGSAGQVFPHITCACQGVIFHTVDSARQCIERAQTTTGLRVTVRILDKVYQIGHKYAADFKQNMKILFDDHLPKWNYRAVPEFTCNRKSVPGSPKHSFWRGWHS